MNGGIDVVVPVAEGVRPREECIAALRREVGDSLRIVTATFGWQARQRAAEESRSDVIAFVDPNVVVCDGWLAALRMAWETSPHSIAAVGGPIRATERVPPWAQARLGLVDLGPAMLEFDPTERTLFAGNLSFWRRSLIGAGGFQPPVDGRDATDWLSEEHEAQRQLGHWGWLVRYAPGAAAERLLGPKRNLSRAWRHGRRSGIAGSRDPGAALRQCAKSSAGALAALAQGKRSDAAERAARAAENLGVLAGNQRSRAPGRTAAHPPPRLTRSTSATHSVVNVDCVLLYHRFAAGEPDPLGLCVSPDNFRAQLALLRNRYDVVPLSDIASAVRSGNGGTGRIAITIDDGYVDNLTAGMPLIAEAGLPATLFAATGHIETGKRFFWDEMQRLISGPGQRPKELRVAGRSWKTSTPAQRDAARAELHRMIQPRSLEEIDALLDELRRWAGASSSEPLESTRPVTVDELKELAQTPGLEIGAHTRDHVNLAHTTPAELRAQIEQSRDDIAQWTGTPPTTFSYPFGIPRHDVTEETRAAVAWAGFAAAVVNQPVAVEEGDDPYAIPRVSVPDVGAAEFGPWLERLFS